MKTVVLDATELRKDWLLTGVTARLLGHAVMQDHLRVCVPPSVVEEIIAHHGRAVSDQRSKLAGVKQEWARLGLGDLAAPTTQFDVRDYLRKRFDEILSFEVLGWPTISHAELVSRAVSRTPPFDDKGGGYRDSLVWANALELARAGADVVLVTADNGFKRTDDTLHDLLRDEVSALGHGGGNVELVRDLTPWLLQNLPWKAENARSAIALARRNDFAEFLHQIDLTEYVDIDPPALGFEPTVQGRVRRSFLGRRPRSS